MSMFYLHTSSIPALSGSLAIVMKLVDECRSVRSSLCFSHSTHTHTHTHRPVLTEVAYFPPEYSQS
jgi:hypothetical protein